MEDYRAQFIDIYNKNVTRPGADRLLKWLEGTDFFTAPASTKFHGACECGLVMHPAARCMQGELLQSQHPQREK